MEKFYLCLPCAAACLLVGGITLAGCSNNDDNSETPSIIDPVLQVGSPSRVFVNDVPKTTSDIKSITLDNQGRVSTMETDNGKVSFTYSQTRADVPAYDVKMVVDDSDDSTDSTDSTYIYTLYLKLNTNGFITKAVEYNRDDNTQNWKLDYTDDGRLNYAEGSGRIYSMTYNNEGDLIQVHSQSEDSDSIGSNVGWNKTCNFEYTSSDNASMVENKGCIMEWYRIYEVDLDRLAYAYYAGLLGKATTHLPFNATYVESYGTKNYTFSWILNKDNYPTELKIVYSGSSESYNYGW